MRDLIKFGANAILVVIISPLMIWAGSTLIEHGKHIARLQEKEKSNKELLIKIDKRTEEIQKYLIESR